jgi:hypothetical protein
MLRRNLRVENTVPENKHDWKEKRILKNDSYLHVLLCFVVVVVQPGTFVWNV